MGVVPAHKNQEDFGQLPHILGKQALEQVHGNSKKRQLDNVKRQDDNDYVKNYLAESRRQHLADSQKQEFTRNKDGAQEKGSKDRDR